MTFFDKTVLWAGPSDGEEVQIAPGTLQVFVPGPTEKGNVMLKGRYQYNSVTKRFEWMGYE